MGVNSFALKINEWMRTTPVVHRTVGLATARARRVALPIVAGSGRGLRVEFGDSTLLRVVSSVEPEVEAAFLSAVKPGFVVFDVGANIGWYSLLAARTASRVAAFEPNPENAKMARRNAATNEFDTLAVIEGAVSSSGGWATFDDSTSLTGHLSSTRGRQVRVYTLDGWARENDCAPDLIKVDVEGVERQVLEGAREILAIKRPILILEMHGRDRTRPILDLLDLLDYTVTCIDFDGSPADAPWWVHLLCVPR